MRTDVRWNNVVVGKVVSRPSVTTAAAATAVAAAGWTFEEKGGKGRGRREPRVGR